MNRVIAKALLFSSIFPATLMAQRPASTPMKVTPNIDSETVNSKLVYTVHLQPLYTTAIHLPETVTSIAVGAPTLFAAEHSKDEPRLVFVKPTTHESANSNLLVALASGRTLSLTLESSGDAGSSYPVDYVVDYSNPQPMMRINTDAANAPGAAGNDMSGTVVGDGVTVYSGGTPAITADSPMSGPGFSVRGATPVEAALDRQTDVAAPMYISGEDLKKQVYPDKMTPGSFQVALGNFTQHDDVMTLSYSVVNVSDHWIEVLPPQIQLLNPKAKKRSKKKPQSLSEQVPIKNYKMTSTKLAPSQRLDAAVVFARPDFKQTKDKMVLQVAIDSAVDAPLLLPLPFVAPGN